MSITEHKQAVLEFEIPSAPPLNKPKLHIRNLNPLVPKYPKHRPMEGCLSGMLIPSPALRFTFLVFSLWVVTVPHPSAGTVGRARVLKKFQNVLISF